MTNQTIWAHARSLDIDGSAWPESYGDSVQGPSNDVAAIRIKKTTSDEAIIIEGRPEDLAEMSRSITRAVELIVEQTMREPQLRRVYALIDPAGEQR